MGVGAWSSCFWHSPGGCWRWTNGRGPCKPFCLLVVEITSYGPYLHLEIFVIWEEWDVFVDDGFISRFSRGIGVEGEDLGDWRLGFICVWQWQVIAAEGRKVCTVCWGELGYEVGWVRRMSTYELEGWQLYASAVTVTHCLGNPYGWEADAYSSYIPGRHWETSPECWIVVKTSFCWVHHVGGTGEVRIGSLERVQFFFLHSLRFWIL